MSKYISSNYAGSILERASYQKDKIKPRKIYGSLIENKNKTKADNGIWQKIKKSMLR